MARPYIRAVPLYRSLPLLMRFGLHGMLLRLRLFSAFVRSVRGFHLDYVRLQTGPHR